jgi:preprotein translocase subunit SecG
MKKSKGQVLASALKITGIWFIVLTIIIFIFNSRMIGTQGHPDYPVYGGINVGLAILSMLLAGIISLIVLLITYLVKSNKNKKGANNV